MPSGLSAQVLGGVLVAIGVVMVFAVFTRSLRGQGEAKVLKGQLAHLSRGQRHALGYAVVRTVVGGQRVGDHHRQEALVVAQWFWVQRWSAVSHAGAVVMVAGLALQLQGPVWLLVLFVAGGVANAVVAVLSAVRAAGGRRYLQGTSTAAV